MLLQECKTVSVVSGIESEQAEKPLLQYSGTLTQPSDSSTSQVSPQTRIFVCISGQVLRLELQNKVQAVFSPLQKAGYDLDIALILSEGEAHFTNSKNQVGEPAFLNYSQAFTYLTTKGYNVLTREPTNQAEQPVVNQHYENKLKQRANNIVSLQERAIFDLRQYEALTKCWRAVPRPNNYEFLLRIRDDTGLEEPLPVAELAAVLQANSSRVAITTDCRAHGGMNDRMAFISIDAAEDFLLSPFMSYYTKPIHAKVKNSESFLYQTYQREGITIIKTPKLRGVLRYKTVNGTSVPMSHELKKRMCPELKDA